MPTAPRIWLIVPPVVVALLDGTLTLCGQPQDYWDGDYAPSASSIPSAGFSSVGIRWRSGWP